MIELSLQEIKETEFTILKAFREFCEKNHIQFYLAHGTLLGALRYKGFIPWDDDIDVLVPRSDYNKLLSLYKDNGQYCLFAPERNQEYRFPFAKFSDITTRKVETGINNGVQLGLDIDVFPLDAWDENYDEAKKEANRISRYRTCLGLTKRERPNSTNILKRAIIRIMMLYCKLHGSRYYIKKINEESYKPHQTGKNYLGCKAWCVYGAKGILKSEIFADTVEVEFEGEKFPAPIGYDAYLRSFYGDYLPEPPVEKRKTHHSFKAYKL